MTVALHPDLPHDLLAHLLVADIAPAKGALSPEFQGYVDAMKKIEDSDATTRKDAQHILSEYEPVCIYLLLTVSRNERCLGSDDSRIPAHQPSACRS